MIASIATFRDQAAVVTGATGAVGQAIATRLLSGGATVCLVGRRRETLESVAGAMSWPGARIHAYAVDLNDDTAVTQFCLDCSQRYPFIHFLVHCAGTIVLDTFQDGRIEDFDQQYRVNVRAPYRITQQLLPQITACRGQVVFINSSVGLQARKGVTQYSATKHALRAVADSLREEVNERGVRVLSVFLGRTASKMQAIVHDREARPYTPERLLQPDDVADVVVHALGLPRTAEVTDVSIRPFVKVQ